MSAYLNNCTNRSLDKYKQQRKTVENVIRQVKQKAGEDFEKKWNESETKIRKQSIKKSAKRECFSTIKSKDGNILKNRR